MIGRGGRGENADSDKKRTMEIKNTEVILNTDFKLFKKEKLVFGQKSEEVKEDTLCLDKSVTVIFGKNGSGKSTLSKRIKETFSDECYLFNGFDGIVGEKKELNAVVLGSKNNEIEEQLKQKEAKKNEIENAIKAINRELEECDENGTKYEDNLFAKRQQAIKVYDEQKAKIDRFYTDSARDIKNLQSIPNYNMTYFKSDIENKKWLSDEERKNNEELLKNSTPRHASLLEKTDFDPKKLSDTVDGILQKSVKEKIIIKRLQDNSKKQAFAREGLGIHERGEVCAFCGNPIADSVFDELEAYFSVGEVKAFEKEIADAINNVKTSRNTIDKMAIAVENFYPQFQTKIGELCGRFSNEKRKILFFLDRCIGALETKKGNLFKPSEPLKDGIETDFESIIRECNKVAEENNAIDVSHRLEEAVKALRLDKVWEFCEEFHYETEAEKLKNLEVRKKDSEDAFGKKEKEKEDKEKEKNEILKEIETLRAKTEDVSILAQHINGKLRGYFSFVLEYVGDREEKNGCYKIKGETASGGYRDVTTLSTGEKNIIAFLYFLETLKEADQKGQENKIIVFDDPMNSNDDAMQYVMTEELRRLCKERKDDRVVIMTHNGHFYIQLLYKSGKKAGRVHLVKSSVNGVEFNVIEKEEDDIKTCYEMLWRDLRSVFESDKTSSEMLKNQMRRIIETYTMFTCKEKESFCNNVPDGFQTLFDVGSHGLDDLEYAGESQEKEELLEIFKLIFEKNGAEEHFEYLWSQNKIK